LLWTGGRGSDSPLTWSSLSGLGRWNYAREVVDPAGVIKRSVNAVGTPAIADLNDVLHLVFLERNEDLQSSESPPNHRDTLVHMQYDDQCQTWGKHASLGISACPSISLKDHEGYLYCGYIDSNQKLCYSMWNEIIGWSHSLLTADCLHTDRSFAFYNVGNSLHLLYAHGKGEVRNLHNLEYDRTACCWLPSHSPSRLDEPFFGGLDVTSSEGRAYVIYRDNDRRPVLMTTNFEARWTVPETVHSEASWELPATAIMNGNLISVWVGEPDSHRKLLWSQRPTMSPIPMNEWMSRIASDIHLSELSIPGSHESCATIAVPWVQCQNMSIEDQLKSGIRYFDFGCGVSFGTLYLFHGRSPLGFTLTEVLARVYAWLARVQREAIMVQIKMEGGTGDETAFEKLLRSEFTKNEKFWALGNTIPKLGAIRGKIQLMRRFYISSGMLGVDVRRWADNSPKFTIPIEKHERMVVQDQYEYTDAVPTFAELVRTNCLPLML
jgi:1-phosphatidylinositol phosphodiesterase